MSATIHVEQITLKEGHSANGPWSRWAIKDANGVWYSTFSEDIAKGCVQGQKSEITFETKSINGRDVNNLKSAVVVDATNGVPDQYRAQTPDGAPDWDKKSLHIARCGLWNHYLTSQLAAMVYHKGEKLEGRDPVDFVLSQGNRIIAHIEKDVFETPPGDDRIPF